MTEDLAHREVLFVAGFGPITQNTADSHAFYCTALGLPLKPMPGNPDYLLTEKDALSGVKHFARWPRRRRPALVRNNGPPKSRYLRRGLSSKCAILRSPPISCSLRVINC